MLPRRNIQPFDNYPWTQSEIVNRGVTAPKMSKNENLYLPARVPTSTSKYAEFGMPNVKVAIKGTGWKSYNVREPVRSVGGYAGGMKEVRGKPGMQMNSPSPEVFEHIWEEGSKRPKTQNEKCRRRIVGVDNSSNAEIFPTRPVTGNNLYDIPIIVIRDDKNRRVASATRTTTTKSGKRPSTFKPGKSLLTSLDQEFLDLFEP